MLVLDSTDNSMTSEDSAFAKAQNRLPLSVCGDVAR